MNVLILNKQHLRGISEHSRMSFPVEACGMLVGKRGHRKKIVERVCPTKNILASASRYEIDPQELVKVFDEAERESKEVLGFYHSHPHWPAHASKTDRSSAFYPNYSYLIYSNLEDEARSYVWNGRRFKPERIKIV